MSAKIYIYISGLEDPVGRVYVGDWTFRRHFEDMSGLGHAGEGVIWGSVLKQGGDEEGDYKALFLLRFKKTPQPWRWKEQRTDQRKRQNRTTDGLIDGNLLGSLDVKGA